MDDGRFDAMARVLGSGAPRRRVLAGLLASLPLALGGNAAAKKKKKKCGNKCIPKSNCCTSAACGPNETCTNGKCTCTPECVDKECGSDGCKGDCGTCTLPDVCDPEGQCCTPDCDGKDCGSDGCGGTCGTCQNGTCRGGGQCLCPFPEVPTNCNSGFCSSCSPGLCCTTNQTCLNGACGACPEASELCPIEQAHVCGRTGAPNPFCYCITSIDDEPTCSSVFGDGFQSRDCTSDADCATLVNLGGAQLVCVDAPCFSEFMANTNVSKICLNKGCVDLRFLRGTARSEGDVPGLRQFGPRMNR